MEIQETFVSDERGESSAIVTRPTDETALAHQISTNNLVTAHLLHNNLNLSTRAIQSILDLINNPSFDKSALTLRSYGDVFANDASVNIRLASQRSSQDSAPPPPDFHPLIFSNLIDFIDHERERLFVSTTSAFADMFRGGTRQSMNAATALLSTLSLVHRSWTRPAQKALGRHIIINGDQIAVLLRKAISSPLFGRWTTHAYISCRNSSFGHSAISQALQGQNINPTARLLSDEELANLLLMFIKRIPCLSSLSFGLEWSSDPVREAAAQLELYSLVFNQLSSLKFLRQVDVLSINGKLPVRWPVLLTRWLAELPRLKVFRVQAWERSRRSTAQDDLQNSISMEEIRPPAGLDELHITLNTAASVGFLAWLFKPNDLDGISQVQTLHLTVPMTYTAQRALRGGVKLRSIFCEFATAVNPVEAFSSLNELRLRFGDNGSIRESTVVDILRSCTSLRVFHISDKCNINFKAILQNLPLTLATLHYGLDLLDGETGMAPSVGSFDSYLSAWVVSRRTELRSISLSLTHRRSALPQISLMNHLAGQEGQSKPKPALTLVEEACRDAGVECKIRWVGKYMEAGGFAEMFDHMMAGEENGQMGHNAGGTDIHLDSDDDSDFFDDPVIDNQLELIFGNGGAGGVAAGAAGEGPPDWSDEDMPGLFTDSE